MPLRIVGRHCRDLGLVNQPLCLHCVISVIAAQMRRCRCLAVILAEVNNGCSSDRSPAAVLWSQGLEVVIEVKCGSIADVYLIPRSITHDLVSTQPPPPSIKLFIRLFICLFPVCWY